MNKQTKLYAKAASAVALALGISLGAAELTVPLIARHEGLRLAGYLDIVNVPTKCWGDTHNVIVGKRYNMAECLDSLQRQIIAHAGPVLECTPALKDHPYRFAAATSLAYNIGGKAYCASSVARHFNAGRWKQACDAFLAWDKAGGRRVPGLARRRADERKICLRNVQEDGK